MRAERRRLEVVASNIANAHTTNTTTGEPYRRRLVVFEPQAARPGDELPGGVQVRGVELDQSEFPRLFRKGHPDADDDGYVQISNVNITHEMVDLMAAMRSYEANLKAARASKQMAERALELGRR